MKKTYKVILAISIAVVLLGALLAGYYFFSAPPQKGDFSFQLPPGYRYDQITDTSCSIIDADGTAVGGIRLTGLRPRDIRSPSSRAFDVYMDEVAYGCEYFSWLGGSFFHPHQHMGMYVTDPETQEKQEYYRYLFVKDFGVYDLWFDSSLISSEAISEFESIVEAK